MESLSLITTGFLPADFARERTVSTVSTEVSLPFTISANFITGAGEAQCHPINRSGLSVAAAIAEIGKPLEFEAKIIFSGAVLSSSFQKETLRSSLSGIASMTKSASFNAYASVVKCILSSEFSASSSLIFPLSTALLTPKRPVSTFFEFKKC